MKYNVTYLVIGPPGTGKTTFLAKQVRKIVDEGGRSMVCSLTNTAAQEVASRDLPVSEDLVGTLHSPA